MPGRLAFGLRHLAAAIEGPAQRRRIWTPRDGYPAGMPAIDESRRLDAHGRGASKPDPGGLNYTDFQSLPPGTGSIVASSVTQMFQLRNLPLNEDMALSVRMGVNVSPQVSGVFVGLTNAIIGLGPAPQSLGGTQVFGVNSPPPLPGGVRGNMLTFPPVQLASGSFAWTQLETPYFNAYVAAGQPVWLWYSFMITGNNATLVTFVNFIEAIGVRSSGGFQAPGSAGAAGNTPGQGQDKPAPSPYEPPPDVNADGLLFTGNFGPGGDPIYATPTPDPIYDPITGDITATPTGAVGY